MGLRISFLEPPGPVDAFRNRACLIWVGLQKVRDPGALLSLGTESDSTEGCLEFQIFIKLYHRLLFRGTIWFLFLYHIIQYL